MVVHIIGVPMDLGGGRRGVDMGPSAIRIASVAEKLKALGHTVIDGGDIAVKTQEQLRIRDVRAKYLQEIARAVSVLSRKVERALEKGHLPLILGGDHSIAIGSISGVSKFCRDNKKKLGVLWVDAHGDINTPETSPSGNIHGMPLAVLNGSGPELLTSVAGDFRKLDPSRVVLVAVRELDKGERENIRKSGVSVFTMEDIDKTGLSDVMKKALRILRSVDCLHVSFDLDAVDPTIAPGVGTPVKGGLDYREAHLIMETLNESGRLTSMDVVEVNPILDTKNQSAEFAVELIESSLGKKII